MYQKIVKPFFDFVFALLAALILAPVVVTTALLVVLFIDRKPFFIQQRPGLKGRIFNIYKLKSMKDLRDTEGNYLPDAERTPLFGKVLRKTSLDELPQLLNILKGEMSFVGPRPLLVPYLPLYSKEQAKRHDVKPGISGWAQVNGKKQKTWQDKFRFDVEYVEKQSFGFDLYILGLTAFRIFGQKDIDSRGEATLTRFNGNN